MTQASVRIDPMDKIAVMALLSNVRNGYPKAVKRSLNAGISAARIEARKQIQREVTLKAKTINAALNENKASYIKLSSSLEADRRPVALINYKTSQTKKGVNVTINKIGKKTLWQGAFIATMKSGHKGVFSRKYKGTGKPKPNIKYGALPRKYRFPIKEQFGPSISGLYERQTINDRAREAGAVKMQNELMRQTDLILSQS